MQTIDLFPLGLVLFPETELPIHIFEEKYKKLINNSIKNKTTFGINQITTQKFYEIGCTAEVVKIIHRYEDGKLDVIVKGIQKYNIVYLNDPHEALWSGEIDYINDIPEILDIYLVSRCVELYNQIADSVKSIQINKLDTNTLTTSVPSYTIATKSGLSNKEKQDLLEMKSENKRLHFLYNHLKTLVPLLKEAEHLSKIIKNDGYLQIK